MKKFLLLAAICCTTIAMAQSQQKRVVIDTWDRVDVADYDGQTKNIHMVRYMFNGWNTFCVPFSMTEQQINDVFGADCKVETLVGAEGNDNDVTIYFNDVKAEGIQANKPYLIYYTGETKYMTFRTENVVLDASGEENVSFSTKEGTNVALNSTYKHLTGTEFYGILAKDNAEVAFSPVSADLSGFYPTRCYLSVNGQNKANIIVKHGTPTSIEGTIVVDENNGKRYNVAGQQVNDSHKGVVIQNGKKYIAR